MAPETPRQRALRMSERFRRERPHRIRRPLSLAIADTFSLLVRALPERSRYWIADRLAALIYRISVTYRENVAENQRQVQRAIGGPEPSEMTVRAVFKTSARNWADLLVAPGKSKRELNDETRLARGSWQILDDALAGGAGAIIVTAHLGAFDYIGHVVNARGYRLTAVTGRTTSRFIFDGVTRLRGAHGLQLVEATPSGVRKAILALRSGGCTVFVNDRDFFQNGKEVEFFGRTTTLPPGAVRIARETGAPIVPIFARRGVAGHELMILEAFRVEKTSNVEIDVRKGLQRVAAAIEEAIGSAPEQWVMFQEAWPSEPVDPVRVFPAESPLSSEFAERVGAALQPRRPS